MAKATSCIKKHHLAQGLVILAETQPINEAERQVRLNISNFSDEDVETMVSNFDAGHLENSAQLDQSVAIKNRVKKDIKKAKNRQEYVKSIMDKLFSQSATSGRGQALALKMVLDTIEGEINKAIKYNVHLSDIQNEAGIPNLPLHRLAATIGRQVLYTKGYGVHKGNIKSPKAARHVEHIYYLAGMNALRALEESGFVTLHEGFQHGKNTIKDYLNPDESRLDYENLITNNVPALELNAEAFGAKKIGPNTNDPVLNQIRGKPGTSRPEIEPNSEFSSLSAMLTAIGAVSLPADIVFPFGPDEEITTRHRNDYQPAGTTAEVKKDLASKPVRFQSSIGKFFESLHEALKDKDVSASEFIKQASFSKNKIEKMFKIEQKEFVESDAASTAGRNLASTTPLDDVVEYFEVIPEDMHMATFAGRNTRLYKDNSVVNPDSSKFMRHALSVDEYTVDKDSPAYEFFIDKVASTLRHNDATPENIKAVLTGQDTDSALVDDINDVLKVLKKFDAEPNAGKKIKIATQFYNKFDASDLAEMITTVQAVQDIMDSQKPGETQLKSTYMVSSDATASGGQLTLMQALGSNPEAIKELMQQLGIFKGNIDENKAVADVYQILQDEIKGFVNDDVSEILGEQLTEEDLESEGLINVKALLKSIGGVLFDGDWRDLSKGPTMTFIYDQSESGAVRQLSKEFAERFLKKFKNASKKDKESLANLLKELNFEVDNINDTVKNSTEFKKELVDSFASSGVPNFLYKLLNHSLTQQYLDNYKTQAAEIFELVESIGIDKIKMYPAPLVLDSELNPEDIKNEFPKGLQYNQADLDNYGVPLSKIFETAQKVGSDVVLTREERVRSTVMNVSSIHSADTANLVYGMKGLISKHNVGAITVHDDIRSAPQLVMDAEQQYIEANKLVGMHFDVHEQVLLAAGAYSTENFTKSPKYVKLLEQVQKAKQLKRKLLENRNDGYNPETTSVIGDKKLDVIPYQKAGKKSVQRPVQSTEQTTKQDGDTVSAEQSVDIDALSLHSKLEVARESSPLIDAYLSGTHNKAKIVAGATSSFDTDTDTITVNKNISDKRFIQEVEHEINHSYTAAIIEQHLSGQKRNLDVAYVEKAMDKLLSKNTDYSKIPNKGLQQDVAFKLNYIRNQPSRKEQLAEFIAIMDSDPDVAENIYGLLDNSNRLVSVVKKILNGIRDVVSRATELDLQKDVNIEQLNSSINAIAQDGKSLRSADYDLFVNLQKAFDRKLNAPQTEESASGRTRDGVLNEMGYWIDAVNESVAKYTVEVAERKGERLVGTLDKFLKVNMPAYRRIVRRTKQYYDDSPGLQQIMHKITNGNVNQLKKNEVLSLFQKISADKENITSLELNRFKEAMADLSDVDRKAFEDFGAKVPMMDYFYYHLDKIKDIDTEIDRLSSHFSKAQLANIDALVQFNVNDVYDRKTPYNLSQVGLGRGVNRHDARKLLVLKSIKEAGPKRFSSLMKNTELVDVIRDTLLANAAILANNRNIDTEQMRDTGLVDEYREPVAFKAISLDQLNMYDENPDWKILRKPTRTSPGVVFQTVIDNTYQPGVFTNIQTNATDVEIPNGDRFKGQPGTMTVNGKTKVVLSRAEKIEAGLITNPAQAMVRTMTHNMAIQDSNVIREKLLQEDTYYDITEEGDDKLIKMIKDPDSENPWFIQDLSDADFNKLHPAIKAKYTRVPSNISNVDGFDERVKYVRKDISYWLVGSSEKSIAANRSLQKGIRIVKDLIAGTKIGMVILNPVKIAKDNLFNTVYLGTMGVGPTEMAKHYRNIASEYHEYKEIQDRLNSLRVRSYASPGKYERQMEKLTEQLKNHPINGVVERGFINSLGSEIVMHEDSPGGGFKSDIDRVLKKLLTDNKGQNNAVGRVIMKVANTPGLSMEGFLESMSKWFKHYDSTKNVEDELMRMSKRMEQIKTDEDVIAYMHQYLNSPDSEFVKLGTHMTDLTDILAKESYYRHLTETQGMAPEKAEIEVLKAFPDYKEGLPTKIKQLDSVGILMFPQYWMRMIQAMYRLAEKRPASFGSEMLIAELLDSKSQLWSQTIFEKAFSNWGLVHNPANHISAGSIVPTNIW